eukprot:1175513-Prymnesium_polylepis.1
MPELCASLSLQTKVYGILTAGLSVSLGLGIAGQLYCTSGTFFLSPEPGPVRTCSAISMLVVSAVSFAVAFPLTKWLLKMSREARRQPVQVMH